MDVANIKYSKSILKSLVILFYCFCLLTVALFAYKRPHYNWDMLAYMALVIQQDHSDINEIHQLTYQTAKENIPPIDYEHLVGGEHRKILSENPGAFFNTLPFYSVKPLYTLLVSLFFKAGFSLPLSTVLPSILFYFLIGLLLFHWLLKYLRLIWTFTASVLIMCSGFMVFMARLSTPDCMSAFLLLSSFYFIIEKPSLKWLFFLLLLSIFARLDNIVPCFFIISFLFFTSKWEINFNLKYYLAILLIFTGCYFGITALTMKLFGWNVFYYPTFLMHLDLSHKLQASFSFKSYLALVISQAATAIIFYNFVFFMFFLSLILYSPTFKFRNFTFEQTFSLLLLVIIIFRFVLFPDLSDRFNISYYLFFLIIFIKKYAGLVSNYKPLSLVEV